MAAEKHPLIVIGSGFGGATLASRLVEAGLPVTLLERGPWRNTDAIRAAGIEQLAPLPRGKDFYRHVLRSASAGWLPGGQLNINHDGLFDLHYDRDLSIVCSSGVGGGSHVYSAMNVRPSADYWQDHDDWLDSENMTTHYDWIFRRLGSKTIDQAGCPVPNAVVQDKQKPQWMHCANIAQPPMGFRYQSGHFTNNSYFGSVDNSKITLDELLLLPLIGKGLQIRDRHEVLDITAMNHGFRLTVMDHSQQRILTLVAEQVIMAAGTLNTLKLLFASRERGGLSGMPALGQGIGGNGDLPGWWALNEKGRDFSTGMPCHGRFAVDGHGDNAILTRFGFNGVDDIPMPAGLRQRLKRDLVLVAMGVDNASGKAQWKRGRLKINYRQQDNPILNELYRTFDYINALGKRPVRYLRKRPITVHPYGGAPLGKAISNSVVNGRGEIHDIPGLFIADASALPKAPGVPPSMTIAAWAGHLSMMLVSKMEKAA